MALTNLPGQFAHMVFQGRGHDGGKGIFITVRHGIFLMKDLLIRRA
jgi:hypothetical protein